MTHVLMYVNGPVFPVQMGSQRVINEIARYVHGLQDVHLTLAVQANPDPKMRTCYAAITHDIVWIPPFSRWSFWSLVNKIVCRLGIDCWIGWGCAHELRRSLVPLAEKADVVLLNYACWSAALPRRILRDRTLVITHDLMFYRRASFGGTDSRFKRGLIALNRTCELSLLKRFWRVGVFAEYEEDLLQKYGLSAKRIVRLGMPISVPDGICTYEDSPECEHQYDFVMVGGNSYQNEEGVRVFFERVVPVLGARNISLAVVGGVARAGVWDCLQIPVNVSVSRLGYVPDLAEVFRKSLIGLGTVPYGSGVKVKVVETMMSGLPMVVTNSGEEGIPVLKEACINIDKLSEEDIRSRVLAWLDNPDTARTHGQLGAEHLKAQFAPDVALRALSKTIYTHADKEDDSCVS